MSPPLGRRWGGVNLRVSALAAGVLVAGCGGSTALSTSVAPARHTAVAASCVGLSPAQELATARLVFFGRMLPGASTELGGRQVLGSPATVRVLRYLKGSGPRRVKVRTAATITNRGVTVAEDGIEPQVGEIWKIYAGSRRQPIDTSICGGSRRVRLGRLKWHSTSGTGSRCRPHPDRSSRSGRGWSSIHEPASPMTPRRSRSAKAASPSERRYPRARHGRAPLGGAAPTTCPALLGTIERHKGRAVGDSRGASRYGDVRHRSRSAALAGVAVLVQAGREAGVGAGARAA